MSSKKSDRERGLYSKYTVTRNDGSSATGGKHALCRYFVLDLDHDPLAAPALNAYALAAAASYPKLAADLQKLAEEIAQAAAAKENQP